MSVHQPLALTLTITTRHFSSLREKYFCIFPLILMSGARAQGFRFFFPSGVKILVNCQNKILLMKSYI